MEKLRWFPGEDGFLYPEPLVVVEAKLERAAQLAEVAKKILLEYKLYNQALDEACSDDLPILFADEEFKELEDLLR